MLADQVKLLSTRGGNKIETILYEINFLAAKGCTKWSGVITEGVSRIVNFFESEGFTVTKSKISPLLITISWND